MQVDPGWGCVEVSSDVLVGLSLSTGCLQLEGLWQYRGVCCGVITDSEYGFSPAQGATFALLALLHLRSDQRCHGDKPLNTQKSLGLHGADCDVGGMQTRLLGSPTLCHDDRSRSDTLHSNSLRSHWHSGDALLDGAAASVSPDASNQCR
ncbi:hypothetical protein BC826DRAFT_224733 [Russula brevipes]|nr:hypothetical protein BC826DRAFT_224733 [Russula brevipes]